MRNDRKKLTYVQLKSQKKRREKTELEPTFDEIMARISPNSQMIPNHGFKKCCKPPKE